MADLFKKLNTLVKANLSEWLSGDREPSASRPVPSTGQVGKDIDREIGRMRERLRDAASYEKSLQDQIDALDQEIKRLDEQADAAVASGDDVNARLFVSDMQRAEQRQIRLMNDLNDHQAVAQELQDRVDQMQAIVDQARQQGQITEEAPQRTGSLPTLSDVLHRMQDSLPRSDAAETLHPNPVSSTTPETAAPTADSTASQPIEDDLEKRRLRLSKKD